MIVNNDRSEAFVSGGSNAITGTIAMNPEMFDLIIRGIYKNPALQKNRATYRELLLLLLISLEQLSAQKTNRDPQRLAPYWAFLATRG